MRQWEFNIVMDRDITADEEHTLNYWPHEDAMFVDGRRRSSTFVDGRISLVHGPDHAPHLELWCTVEAPTLLDAAHQAIAEIREVADLRPVRIEVAEEHRSDLDGLARVA